jgi:toxin HigB-1
VIRSWRNKDARLVFEGRLLRTPAEAVQRKARRLLAQLNAAVSPMDLAAPPGNMLKKLEGGERWSIRVNDQYRITFVWGAAGPEDVWFGDYH